MKRKELTHTFTMIYQVEKTALALLILKYFSVLRVKTPTYLIEIFTHLKLCLADAIHNFKWVKIMPI